MTEPICELCPFVRDCPECMFRGGAPTDPEEN